jgi:hypothetical protein
MTVPDPPPTIKVLPLKDMSVSIPEVTDTDTWSITGGPQNQPASDRVTYVWGGDGTFPDGNEGTSVRWLAPESPGLYTVTCTVKDAAEMQGFSVGTRDDTDLSYEVKVDVIALSLDFVKGVIAAGAISNEGHKSNFEIKATDSNGTPVPGISVSTPIDISEGHDVPGTTNPTITLSTSTTNAQGVAMGEYMSGNRMELGQIKLPYRPGYPNGPGPSDSIGQVWNELEGSPDAWDYPGYFIPGKAEPITYIMKFDSGKPISGHSLEFKTTKLIGREWDPEREIDEDGDGIIDYVGAYVERVAHAANQNGQIGPNGIYTGLVQYGSIQEGAGANAGKYTGTQKIDDYVGPEGYTDYYVDDVEFDVLDHSSLKPNH